LVGQRILEVGNVLLTVIVVIFVLIADCLFKITSRLIGEKSTVKFLDRLIEITFSGIEKTLEWLKEK